MERKYSALGGEEAGNEINKTERVFVNMARSC